VKQNLREKLHQLRMILIDMKFQKQEASSADLLFFEQAQSWLFQAQTWIDTTDQMSHNPQQSQMSSKPGTE
jgi:hypothetical protein